MYCQFSIWRHILLPTQNYKIIKRHFLASIPLGYSISASEHFAPSFTQNIAQNDQRQSGQRFLICNIEYNFLNLSYKIL